jgi:exodeoxyribonuclease VII small subunit
MAKKTIEQTMVQLEEIVEELESGDLVLEKALKRFEEGINLSRWCAAKLDETEQKISVLVKNQGKDDSEEPFLNE